MKYLVLEKGEGQGCDYTIGCNQRWKIIESDLPYEQFRNRCVKYAVFGGDANANPKDYTGVCTDNKIVELHIIELPTLLTTDMEYAYSFYESIINEGKVGDEQQRKRELYRKLKAEFGD